MCQCWCQLCVRAGFPVLSQLVQLLLRHGANPLQTNSKGKSPLDVAANDMIHEVMSSELIASNSSASSLDEVRSPTSPESNTSDRGDEDVLPPTGLLGKKAMDNKEAGGRERQINQGH